MAIDVSQPDKTQPDEYTEPPPVIRQLWPFLIWRYTNATAPTPPPGGQATNTMLTLLGVG